MMMHNPEFTKNLKLECSLTRILIPLIIFLLVCWVGWTSGSNETYMTRPVKFYQADALFAWLCGFGFLFSIVWGTYLASNSLQEEIKQKTWDFVRMSSLSPAKILIGKLFGSTAIVWGITLCFILPLIATTTSLMIPVGGIRPAVITVVVLCAIIGLWTLLSHAFALLIGLSTPPGSNRSSSFLNVLPSALGGLWIGGITLALFDKFHGLHETYRDFKNEKDMFMLADGRNYMWRPDTTTWYDMTFYYLDVLLMVLAFLTFWTVIGAYRALRRTLQYRDLPWCWVGLLLTGGLFLQGFTFEGLNSTILWGPIFLSIATLILTCPAEAGESIRYRLLGRQLSSGQYAEALRTVPLWMISCASFVICAVLTVVINGAERGVMLSLLSFFVFMTRDLLVLHVIAWTPNIRRPLLGMGLYLACFYGLFPIIADTLSKDSYDIFYPLTNRFGDSTYWGLLALEIAVVLPLFIRRWRGAFGEKSGNA